MMYFGKQKDILNFSHRPINIEFLIFPLFWKNELEDLLPTALIKTIS
jgi:hypothetical protein